MVKKEQVTKGKPQDGAPKPQPAEKKAAPTGSCCGTKPGVKPTKA